MEDPDRCWRASPQDGTPKIDRFLSDVDSVPTHSVGQEMPSRRLDTCSSHSTLHPEEGLPLGLASQLVLAAGECRLRNGCHDGHLPCFLHSRHAVLRFSKRASTETAVLLRRLSDWHSDRAATPQRCHSDSRVGRHDLHQFPKHCDIKHLTIGPSPR